MTAALELVARLRARGIALEPDGGTLVVRPAHAVRPDEVEALKRHKTEVLQLLSVAPSRPSASPQRVPAELGVSILRAGDPGFTDALGPILGLPLHTFAAIGDQLLEVRVPWHAETVWFVRAEGDVAELVCDGVSRGRIWTAGELEDLLAVPGVRAEDVRLIALTKIAFGGEVAEVRHQAAPHQPLPPSSWPDALPGLGPRRITAFTSCLDCVAAGGHTVTWRSHARGLRVDHEHCSEGTWIVYGARSLCLSHAQARAARFPAGDPNGIPNAAAGIAGSSEEHAAIEGEPNDT